MNTSGSKLPIRSLDKAILSQGLVEFKRQLEYKLGWNGGLFAEVNPAYTSQTCSQCGHVHKDNRTSQSDFTCVDCEGRVSQSTPCAPVASPTRQEPAEEMFNQVAEDSVGISTPYGSWGQVMHKQKNLAVARFSALGPFRTSI